ncbi:MAG: PilW family protein [Candidatus Doudnabacteria bacterium]
MKNTRQNQKGFTLIEAIVATALFAVTVSSIMGVYLSTLKINRRTDVIRSASENARYITGFITKEVRNGQIDYYGPWNAPCSGTISSSASSLSLVNTDNEHLCFYLGDGAGFSSSSGTNLWLIKNNLAAVKVNSNNVSINNLVFYVSPTYNPYSTGSNAQPRVTIMGNVTATSGSQDTITIPIQATVSIPSYDISAGP